MVALSPRQGRHGGLGLLGAISLSLVGQCGVQPLATRASNVAAIGKRTSSFWDDRAQVSALADPPSPARWQSIREAPWRGGLEPAEAMEVTALAPENIEGRIPADLVGIVTRNGAGRIRVHDRQYGHWFDGDGLVSALHLNGKDNSAKFGMAWVQTDKFAKQEALKGDRDFEAQPPFATMGVWTKRGKGAFWQNMLRQPSNPGNTATQFVPGPSGPRLLALCEGSAPVAMDPETLATIGPVTLTGPSGHAESAYSAHFSRCLRTGDVFNHGAILGGVAPRLNVLHFDSNLTLKKQRPVNLPYFGFVHDSTLSDSHLSYIVCPYAVPDAAFPGFLAGRNALGNLFKWDPTLDTVLHIHSRDTLALRHAVALPTATLYHIVDSWEDAQQRLYVRTANLAGQREDLERGFKDLYQAETLPLCTFHEYVVDLTTGKLLAQKRLAPEAALMEYPTKNSDYDGPRRFAWVNAKCATSPWINGLQKVDLKGPGTGALVEFGEGSYAGAPEFIAKVRGSAEDDGYIVAPVYRSAEHRSDWVILDAASMETLATIKLDRHVPYQFHGDFLRT